MGIQRTCLRAALVMVAALVTVATFAGAAASQGQPSYLVGGYTMAGFPTGDWGEIAGFGLGFDGTNVVYRKPDRPIAVRSSFGFLYNFSRTQSIPQGNLGANSQLDLETKNGSIFFGIGPEFARVSGDMNPFLFGTAGFNTYWTESDLKGTAGGAPYDSKFGDSRIAFAWSAGFGIRRKATEGAMLELSAEYRSGPGHMFVLPGEITNTGTTVNVERKERTTDQIIVRLGTVFAY